MLYANISDKAKFEYDVVTGVSAGSINLGGVAVFPKGQEEEMVHVLSDNWQKLTTDQMYVQWKPFGMLTGLNKKTGLLNTAPMQKFLEDFFDDYGGKILRKIGIAAVDANSGMFTVFNETDPEPIKAIMSSAAIPFIFPNVKYQETDQVMIDGGIVYTVDLVTAVKRCREQVTDDSQIVVDVIHCNGPKLEALKNTRNARDNYMRYKLIKDYNNAMMDFLGFMRAYPKVDFRYFVQPSQMSSADPLDADNSTVTYPLQMDGRQDGENVVNSGEGFYFNKMNEYIDSKELQ